MRSTRLRIVTMTCSLLMFSLLTLGLMLRHEPEFYRRVAMAAGPQREETSNDFVIKDVFDFISNFLYGADSTWTSTFTQDQLNSYFQEAFIRLGDADNFSDIGISDIRIEFIDDQIRVGFRYGTGALST